jgi:hypothetical protein
MAKLTSRFHANILAMRLREKTRDGEDPSAERRIPRRARGIYRETVFLNSEGVIPVAFLNAR